MDNLLAATISKNVEVEYETPDGNSSSKKGKLRSFDSYGYVVIEIDGKKIYINKDRVYVISEQDQ